MGACCSKTHTTTACTEVKVKPNPVQPEKNKNNAAIAIVASPAEPQAPKKDVFVVKHRKNHEIDRHTDPEICKSTDQKKNPNSCPDTDVSKSETSSSGVSTDESGKLVGTTVRTSSCTKEEVDAILIQCGRLSRSSSDVKPAGGETPTRVRRYSGSKRSFDFEMEIGSKDDDEAVVDGGSRREQREPRVSSPSSSRRRSRERDPQQQKTGSKERGSGGRRVSRSPNRRSESPNPNSNGSTVAGCVSNRPGKMVSVPATEKNNNASGGDVVAGVSGGVKKIQMKRNAGEAVIVAASRAAASPRSGSPANIRVLNENQNPQPLTLSRSNSRKAEHSPYKRNPLGEIDTNVAGSEQPGCKKPNGNQTVSRTRSSRLSRDLDINVETLINPNTNPPSYASLLLEDIQNFHQKNPPTAAPASPLLGCVSKACTILEAVADLKSATSSNDRQINVVNDDLMEPSLHKYVTVRRGGGGDADTEEQESSGSNSFAGSQQLSWMSSSWELNSGDSTDCWTSKSRSDVEVERSGEYPRNGIGRGRVGVHGRSAYSLPNNATKVAST